MTPNNYESPVSAPQRSAPANLMRLWLIMSGAMFALALLWIAVRYLSPDDYGVYKGGGLEPTPQLAVPLAPSLARLKAAGLCNVWSRVRTWKMGPSDGLTVESCTGDQVWMEEDAQSRSITLDAFAIVDRHHAPVIVTRGARGSSTLVEYERAIPTIVDRAIAKWPAAAAALRARQGTSAASQDTASAHQREVEKSFAK